MTLTKKQLKERRRLLYLDNAKWPRELKQIPVPEWPRTIGFDCAPDYRFAVYRSRAFLVQCFRTESGTIRITVNRSELDSNGMWRDGIAWEELMEIKRQIGYGERWAVELFPDDRSIVNVANMRHLFLLDDAPPYAWKSC